MSFFQVAPEFDDRSRSGLARVRLENCELEPATSGVYRSKFLVRPTPGRVEVADLGGFVRGVFGQAGVQNGTLFTASGRSLYSLDDDFNETLVGSLAGADTTNFDGLRNKLMVRAGGELKVWDGSSFTKVTDVHAPSSAKTLACCALRVISAESTGDAFGWSKAGLPLDWDAAGQAADFYLPDPIVSQWRQGDDFISFNAASLQRWRATGADEAGAFAPVIGASVSIGAISTNCPARVGDDLAFVSHELVPHIIGGGGPRPIENKAVTDALVRLTETQKANIAGWSYTDGERSVYGIRAPGSDVGFCYDLSTRSWHTRRKYGASQYDLAYATTAYGKTFVASPTSSKIWRLDREVYTDAGDPVVRVMTLFIPLPEQASIDSLQLLMQCVGQPVSGQGSEPKAMVRASRDGGQTFTAGPVREVSLATPGKYHHTTYMTRWGRFSKQYGALFEITISDPIGFMFEGVLVNEDRIM